MSYDEPIRLEHRQAALRIIDANLNRASEGLRVVEEYCRFVLSDRHLTGCCKSLRDRLAGAVRPVQAELVAARDTLSDVGAMAPFTEEIGRHESRTSLDQIAAVNAERVKQAMRAIEEFAKLVDPTVAGDVEALRYQWYTLEKAYAITAVSQQRLLAAKLYVLIDGSPAECAFVERAQGLIEAGVHVLQLRDKQLDDRTLLTRARLLRRIIDDSPLATQHSRPRPLFIMNDRPDIAVLACADGVHVGQKELDVRDVRRIVGPNLLIGVSTHTIEQARQAVLDGANYIGCGPTFPSGTKHFDHFPGLEYLRQVAAEVSLPAFAIGGITRENFGEVLATGFTRVAVGGAVAKSSDPTCDVRDFLVGLTS
jgi:thiamine-phosphate pyrophosphorylase